ncbi:MAG: MotA/TolQ/ExbB proton channel family protein [Planctomycetota bacterium]
MNLSFVLDFFNDGGPVMIPILLVSIAIWALIIERVLYFRRHGTGSATEIIAFVSNTQTNAPSVLPERFANTILGRYLSIAVERGAFIANQPRDLFAESEMTLAPELNARTDWLKTLAAIAPLLGLFGTVTGMIETFDALTVQYSGDPRTLSAGVSTALLTTQAGLVAGLPGLIAATMITNRVRRIHALMLNLKTSASNRIEAMRKGGVHAPTSAPG